MDNKRHKLFNRRTLSTLVVVCIAILLFMALSNFGAVVGAIGWFFSIFSPFAAGVCIAYLLNMPMRFLENKLFHRFKRKRALAILTTYLGALLVLALLLGLVIPQLIDSISTLLRNATTYLNNLNGFVNEIGMRFEIGAELLDTFLLSYNDLVNQVVGFVRSILPDIVNWGVQFGSGLVSVLTALIASIYMLFGKEKLTRQCRRVLYAVLPAARADNVMRVGRLSDGVFSGFISGKLLDSLIIGIICFVGLSIMNILGSVLGIAMLSMPFTPLISVIIGVTNVIPFFGPFIGAIPSAMILLMINPGSALVFVIFIIVLQQFDGNILGPKILGQSTGLPAIWVLVAIIVGGGLFGFMGMLLGVPTTAVVYTLASDFVERRLRRKGLAEEGALTTRMNGPAGPLPYEMSGGPAAHKADVEASTAPEAGKPEGEKPGE
ncbi:AI-2E family transporter [Ruminococcaceae bacterium OttesenSCG-928-D13]|nr:AI-2E family transporter [Ruminococcaceae bacterium OttesenSCG-928-D13]